MLTVFGACAVAFMMLMYALEHRRPAFVLAFAFGCALSSTYGFLAGVWPFGVVEAIWARVAVNRYRKVRSGTLSATYEARPVAAPSCALNDSELREQLARYRVAGAGAEVLEWDKRRRAIRVAPTAPDSVVDALVEVERACCPFFELGWDRTSRRLTISVSASDHEPALDAITYALGVVEPSRDETVGVTTGELGRPAARAAGPARRTTS